MNITAEEKLMYEAMKATSVKAHIKDILPKVKNRDLER